MRSFPFDSLALYQDEETGLWMGDRQSSAQDVRDINKIFWKNGVCLAFENAFQVTPGEGMNVIVAPGVCGIEGTLGIEDSERGMTLQASSSEDRIDTIVLRLNLNVEARKIDIYVKTGVAQSVPVRPQLTRSESVWELGIADIFVAKNSGAISAARITDTRLQTERCGAMAPLMEVDTTSFYEQLKAQTQIAVDLAQSAIDGTTAGNLQRQITDNTEDITDINDYLKALQGELAQLLSLSIGTAHATYSIGSGSYADASFSVEDTREVVGMLGYGSGNKYITVSSAEIASGGGHMTLFNQTTSVINNQKAYIKYAYRKNA